MDEDPAASCNADAYTVETFCERHEITPSYLALLWRRGLGPDFMDLGTRKRISREAAARWRREREKREVTA